MGIVMVRRMKGKKENKMKNVLITLGLLAVSANNAFATQYDASIAELNQIISSNEVKSAVGLGTALVSTEKKFNNGYYYVLRFYSRIGGDSCVIATPTYNYGIVTKIKASRCN
jgi:hypothetical protein